MKKLGAIALAIVLMLPASMALAQTAQAETDSWTNLMDKTVGAIDSLTNPTGNLEVNGQAALTVVPDTATISVGISIEKPTVKEAQEAANTVMNSMIDALKALQIAENQMVTSNFSVYPSYDYSQEVAEVRGYTVSHMLTVTVLNYAEDTEKINTVIDTAVEKGANQIYGIQFSYSDEGSVYRQALANAIGAAREKAEVMAEAAGVKLGALLEIHEGTQGYAVFNTYARSEVADSGAGTSLMAGETEISASVTLVYEVR